VPAPIAALLLDIEGTTTPVSFVYDVLFPFARAHLREFLDASSSSPAVAGILNDLRADYQQDALHGEHPPQWADITDRAAAAAYVEWLMDRDRKSRALKALQGEIWESGYRDGRLRGEVFADVPPAFERWSARGVPIYIYSSGSVLAQRRLFATTQAGDLTAFLRGYFDTAVGPKTDARSYERIAVATGCRAADVLFISDTTRELDASRNAGLQTLCIERPGNATQADDHIHARITSFDQVPI